MAIKKKLTKRVKLDQSQYPAWAQSAAKHAKVSTKTFYEEWCGRPITTRLGDVYLDSPTPLATGCAFEVLKDRNYKATKAGPPFKVTHVDQRRAGIARELAILAKQRSCSNIHDLGVAMAQLEELPKPKARSSKYKTSAETLDEHVQAAICEHLERDLAQAEAYWAPAKKRIQRYLAKHKRK